jgi:hypothetical protein
MKIEKVELSATYGRKINLGNYENEDFFETIKASVLLDENESLDKSKLNKLNDDLFDFCKEKVYEQILQSVKARIKAKKKEEE